MPWVEQPLRVRLSNQRLFQESITSPNLRPDSLKQLLRGWCRVFSRSFSSPGPPAPQNLKKNLPAPSGIPRPAGTPFPGPAVNPPEASAVDGGGPSTVTLTIDSPRRMTRPSVRFCWTEGAASVVFVSFAFLPWHLLARWSISGVSTLKTVPTLTVLNSSHSARTKFMCLSYANI
jgi:hypothetical protein